MCIAGWIARIDRCRRLRYWPIRIGRTPAPSPCHRAGLAWSRRSTWWRATAQTVVPVDYKRGKRPHVAAGAYEPERVQICVQGLLLEENGYRCTEGALYFAESRERVRVVFDDELRDATRGAIGGLRLVAAGGRIPAPLRDSPKCPRCSLVGICLPDEVNHFHRTGATPRPIAVRHDEMLPLYVQANNARLAKKAETITITEEDGPTTTARLIDVSQVVLMGNVRMTTPCLHELMRREIPVTWHSYGGWFLGHTMGLGHKKRGVARGTVPRELHSRRHARRFPFPGRGQGAQLPHDDAAQLAWRGGGAASGC